MSHHSRVAAASYLINLLPFSQSTLSSTTAQVLLSVKGIGAPLKNFPYLPKPGLLNQYCTYSVNTVQILSMLYRFCQYCMYILSILYVYSVNTVHILSIFHRFCQYFTYSFNILQILGERGGGAASFFPMLP